MARKPKNVPMTRGMQMGSETLPAKPKIMPAKAPVAQPDHPRVAQAKRQNNNMAQAMKGRK